MITGVPFARAAGVRHAGRGAALWPGDHRRDLRCTRCRFFRQPGPFTPSGNGFAYYFDADPDAQHNASEQDSVNRFLASPDGGDRRVDNDFSALGHAGLPTKAPPVTAAPPALARDWLAWIDVRGTQFDRTAGGSDPPAIRSTPSPG